MEEETNSDELIVVDEVQKLPSLLDEVHRLIASRGQKFVLTGSSARKLKRGAANLLAGRARWLQLYPLVSAEIPDFDLAAYLNSGGLPQMHGDAEAYLDLRSYVDLYLREEIHAEALTRNIGGFSRLLDALGLSNGEELNYASLSSDTAVHARTIANYVGILEDTLLAFQLPVYRKTRKRKTTSRSKLYFFDVGVTNALCGRRAVESSPEAFGKAFEHFIILEVRAYLRYWQIDLALSYWRTQSGLEVDLVVGDALAIEIKASSLVSDKHLKGLRALKEELNLERAIVVSRDPISRRTQDGIEILPWAVFLEELWGDRLVK
jgi:predicted AAA+ superfamily ATPase